MRPRTPNRPIRSYCTPSAAQPVAGSGDNQVQTPKANVGAAVIAEG